MIVVFYSYTWFCRKLLASRRPSRYLHGASRTAVFWPLPPFHPLPLFTPGQKRSIGQSWLDMVAEWVDEAFQIKTWARAQTWREVGVNASRNLHGSFTGKG